MLVTPHFALREFRCKDGTPYPVEWIGARLTPLCLLLEEIRRMLGNRSIQVVSGFRTPGYNRKVGGARKSQHVEGRAADIRVVGVLPERVFREVERAYRSGSLERLGGLGLYPSFTHVDVREGKRLAKWIGSGAKDSL